MSSFDIILPRFYSVFIRKNVSNATTILIHKNPHFVNEFLQPSL